MTRPKPKPFDRIARSARSLSWSPPLHVLHKTQRTRPARRFQAYCVSIGKSGTHSVADMFAARYRAKHEPELAFTVDLMTDAARGDIGRRELRWHVKARDRRLWLEMESSMLLFDFVDVLVEEFPESRFVLTIRDCFSWLDSQVNQHLTYHPKTHWRTFREHKFRIPGARHPERERPLAEAGLFTVDEYLTAWREHNRTVLATVPAERLLVIRTHELSRSAPRLAEFVGVPADTLDTGKSHAYKAKEKHDMLPRLGDDYLGEKFETHCTELMDRFFPEPQYRSLAAWRAWEASRR